MAKTAWIERNKKKAATVKKYAALRAELKAKKDYAGLAKLPRNASPSRVVNRCSMSGRRHAYQRKKGVIEGLRRISTPGLRRYVGATDIPRVRGGLGVAVLSTSEGLMTGTQARKKNLGGELLCYVW